MLNLMRIKQLLLNQVSKWQISDDCGLIKVINEVAIIYDDNKYLQSFSSGCYKMREILDWNVRAVCVNEEISKQFFSYTGDTKHKHLLIFKKDNVETEESVKWLIMHEITHAYVSEYLLKLRDLEDLAVNELATRLKINSYKEIVENDGLHESLPEEALANTVATMIVGADYNRFWWRKKQKVVEGGNK